MTHISDVFDEDELDAIEEAKSGYQERKQTQQDFINAVSDESETELLNTKCTLAEGHTVELEAKLNGRVIDALSAVQERLESAGEEERLYKVPEAIDDACQLLSDIVVDSAYDKETFYTVYEENSPDDIAKMLSRAFESLEKERRRLSGDAEGFRNRT